MPSVNTIRLAALVVFLCLSQSSVTASSITEFTNLTAWEDAAGNASVLSFAAASGSSVQIDPSDRWFPSGLTIDGFSFTGSVVGGGQYLVLRTSTPRFLYGPPDGSLGCPPPTSAACGPPNAGISVTVPSQVTAVGWYFGNFYEPGGVTVTFANGQSFSDSDFSGFIGFVSTASNPLLSFEILSAGYPSVAGFSFVRSAPLSQAQVVAIAPESNTMLLFALALVPLIWKFPGSRRTAPAKDS